MKYSLLKDIIVWDVKNWSVALNYWEKATTIDLRSCYGLEVGAEYGGLSLWLALKGANVLCSDIISPKENAWHKHTEHNVSSLIEYEALDIASMPYKDRFDVIMLKSVLGALGKGVTQEEQIILRGNAIQEMHKALKPGGELFFVENLVASPLHRFLRKLPLKRGKIWKYMTIVEMINHLSIFNDYQFITVGFLGQLGKQEWTRYLFGTLDRMVVDALVPKSWRYLIIGVARK